MMTFLPNHLKLYVSLYPENVFSTQNHAGMLEKLLLLSLDPKMMWIKTKVPASLA
jgi:hypothetical protein